MKNQHTRFILTSFLFLGLSFGSLLFMSFIGAEEEEGKITIIVDNVKSAKGSIALGLYKDQTSFSKEEPFKKIIVPKRNYKNKQVQFNISLPKGTYGIALLDDENDNKKMDYSFAFPQEGYGFSNYYHKGWSRPSFSKFDFYHNGQQSTVKITVQYF
ncbi:MAG: DUF2141 domain-containing protein [Aureispira sp.]